MSALQRTLFLRQPRTIVVGAGSLAECAADLAGRKFERPFVVTGASGRSVAAHLGDKLQGLGGGRLTVHAEITREPTVAMFREALAAARSAQADAIIGIGGGSPLDVAKLVAAFLRSDQSVNDAFGIDKLLPRATYLACVPTTAGTGSEVSPNAILLDESDRLKKGVISPHLVPDAAYIDPLLTVSMPAAVTASTGFDALTHCIEGFANRFAHPLVDVYALQGIRLIARSLAAAVEKGDDVAARSDVAMGSLYGGLCLGPVNTAAVHALAYPLGGEFGIAHGTSNALLLPHVWNSICRRLRIGTRRLQGHWELRGRAAIWKPQNVASRFCGRFRGGAVFRSAWGSSGLLPRRSRGWQNPQ